jgi:arylsulfatase
MPDKLRELQELFLIEASKYNVFPLDDRRYERFNPAIAGRPDLPRGRTTMTFYPGMTHLMEMTVLNVKNRSHTITAEVEIPEEGTSGVIIAQGGRFAGWSLYVKDGAAKYCHNFLDKEYSYVGGEEKLPTGTVNIRYHFDFDGGQPGAGGTGTLHVNGKGVAEGRISHTVPFIFAADETLDVGVDGAAPVTDDYPEGEANQFTGKINWVRVDLEEDDVSHLEPEEQKYHRIMARQ